MELTNVVRAVRRHWIIVVLAFSVVMVLGLALAYMPPDRYKATAVVLVQPDPTKAQFQVQVVAFVVPSIIAQGQSRTFADSARAGVPESLRGAPVKVDIADADGAGVLTITASSTQRTAVAPWATAYAKELVKSPTGAGYVTLGLLDEARPPRAPYAPQRQPVVISGVFLGLIVGVLAAIAAAAFRRRGDELDEIRVRFGTTVLGEMPMMRDMRRRGMDVIFGANVPPEVTEALQSLRTNVEFLLHDRHPRSVALVSATSGEGKSTITAALAWALASVGEQVTAVDADLRRPTLHHYLHGRLALGVASADEVPIDRLLQRTALSTLRLMSAGVPNRHPAEVLRANLPLVLAALEDDTVVIDCPPMDGFAETGSITTMAQSVILVIDRRRHDLLDVERSLAVLHDRGADVLGIVINRSNRKSAAGKYYYEASLPPARNARDEAMTRDVAEWLPTVPTPPTPARAEAVPPRRVPPEPRPAGPVGPAQEPPGRQVDPVRAPRPAPASMERPGEPGAGG